MNQHLHHCPSAIFILVICIGLSLSACSSKDDTEAIRELIQQGSSLAEEKQVGDLMDLALPAFISRPGGYDELGTKRILFAAFRHYGEFELSYPRPQVEVLDNGDSATATIHFLIVRQDQSIPGLKELYDDPRKWIETASEKADLYKLKLALKKDGGDWLVAEANLEGFKGVGF